MHEDDSAPPNSRAPRSADEDHIIVGRIRAAWGVRGDLKVDVLSDDPDRFSKGSTLFLDGKPVQVERSRNIKNALLVKLDAAEDRTAAEKLRDKSLTIPRNESNPLPEGSYYYFQILDMNVQTDEGEYLGKISEIISTGSNDVYVVNHQGRRDVLVPSIEDVVLDVSLDDNLMTVHLPEGLR